MQPVIGVEGPKQECGAKWAPGFDQHPSIPPMVTKSLYCGVIGTLGSGDEDEDGHDNANDDQASFFLTIFGCWCERCLSKNLFALVKVLTNIMSGYFVEVMIEIGHDQ